MISSMHLPWLSHPRDNRGAPCGQQQIMDSLSNITVCHEVKKDQSRPLPDATVVTANIPVNGCSPGLYPSCRIPPKVNLSEAFNRSATKKWAQIQENGPRHGVLARAVQEPGPFFERTGLGQIF